jgi:hypothetical protein
VSLARQGARSADPNVRSELPNITYAGDTGPEPRPAGFGPVGRGWQPRLPLAGTYDGAWLAEQWPLPPHDFDPRHHLCAPADQQAPALAPGTPVTLVNMNAAGRWAFRLPQLRVPLRLIYADRIESHAVTPDTLILEPGRGRATFKARRAVRLVRNRPRLSEVVLGHVSPVWLNARRKGKTYLNPLGGDGTLRDEPVWQP